MTATPDTTTEHRAAPAPTTDLAGRLAAELRALAEPLAATFNAAKHAGPDQPADPAHPRPVFNAAALVPGTVAEALDVAAALERLVADPPANLLTRARLVERHSAEASAYLGLLAPLAAAVTAHTPPADIGEAIEAACVEVARLEDHAASWRGVTYDDGDEAGAFAPVLAAQSRGEVIGARRVLAILLGLEAGEVADGGEAELYVAAWRAGRAAADAAADRQAMTEAVGILHKMIATPDGPDWGTLPLILAGAALDHAHLDEGTEAHAEIHGTLVVPARFATTHAVFTYGNALPNTALDALVRLAHPTPEDLYAFLAAHVWNDDGGHWVPVDGTAAPTDGTEYTAQ